MDRAALIPEILAAIRAAQADLAQLTAALAWAIDQQPAGPAPEWGPPEPGPGEPIVTVEPAGRRTRRPAAVTERLARDWARAQGERWWSARELSAALGYGGAHSAYPTVTALLERGTIVHNGRPTNSSQRAYRWAGKPEPSPAIAPGDGSGDGRAGYSATGAVEGTGRPRASTTAKDYGRVVARARARGWRLEPVSRGKDRLIHPSGAKVTLAVTPSDHRAAANLEATLKRAERTGTIS